MAKHADTSSKRLFAGDPESWVRFIFPGENIRVGALLSPEFQWIQRHADFLLKVYHPFAGEFILLCEVQLYYELFMPLRLQAYSSLTEEKYKLPVYPVLINILPPAKGVSIPTRHERTFLGLYTCREYRVINLWEIDADVVLEQYSPSLVPLVPVMRGGNTESMLIRATQKLQGHSNKEEMEVILGLFASLVMDHEILAKYVRWNMTVLQESPLLQQIIEERKQEWLTIGRKEGQKKGIEIGESQGLLRMLQRVLTKRFGELSPMMIEQLRRCSVEQLERLADEALTAATLDDFQAHAHLPIIETNDTTNDTGGNQGTNGNPQPPTGTNTSD